ncbi:helix-turn-helix transcriptional regulator [Paenibacillus algorifonticola]|uniref:helix-turn-helix transcriptional regulator n=1 Tax=Paenibacillus algorifonticola TaxID=684063 RepID=UPI003D2BEFE3
MTVIVQTGVCLIPQLRQKRRLTQEQLAEYTGINRTRLSRLETKLRDDMTLTEAQALSKVLKCSKDDLYTWLWHIVED